MTAESIHDDRLERIFEQGIQDIEFTHRCRVLNIHPKDVPIPALLLVYRKNHKSKMVPSIMQHGPVRFKRWQGRRRKDIYMWTPVKTWLNGKERYVGLFYRHREMSDGKKKFSEWSFRKILAFNTKKLLKARLLKLYDRNEGTSYSKNQRRNYADIRSGNKENHRRDLQGRGMERNPSEGGIREAHQAGPEARED